MKTRNVIKTEEVKEPVCKTFNVWKNNRNQKIEILGNNEKTPFRKGNRALVDGKVMQLASVEIEGKEVKIINGRIAAVNSINAKEPGTRSVFKPEKK